MRAALVKDNTVINVIEYDPESDYDPGESALLIELADEEPVGPMWKKTSSGFEAPTSEADAPLSEDKKQEKRLTALEAAVDQLILDQLMGG